MMSSLDLRGRTLDVRFLRRELPRAEFDVTAALEQVRPICEDVEHRGAAALRDLGERFDGVRPTHLRVPRALLQSALDQLDPDLRAALAVASPPQRENVGEFAGYPNPTILAACALLGVDEVYAVGGAQAVAMFAHGFVDDDPQWGEVDGEPVVCDPVSLVTGPGNIWVVAAKRLLKGLIGIDAEAGPTEIAILADDSADADHVAADLVSQAEHDPLAASVLVTDSEELAEETRRALARRVPATKHAERVTQALEGTQSRIVLVDDVDAGLAVVNAYAAEHLEIQTRDAAGVAARVRNAGAVFVGPHSPVSLGDYAAGSNHVLPTAGCACHSSGLSVQSFLRGIHVVDYDEPALRDVARHVVTLAQAEDLPAHGEAVTARFGDEVPR